MNVYPRYVTNILATSRLEAGYSHKNGYQDLKSKYMYGRFFFFIARDALLGKVRGGERVLLEGKSKKSKMYISKYM